MYILCSLEELYCLKDLDNFSCHDDGFGPDMAKTIMRKVLTWPLIGDILGFLNKLHSNMKPPTCDLSKITGKFVV